MLSKELLAQIIKLFEHEKLELPTYDIAHLVGGAATDKRYWVDGDLSEVPSENLLKAAALILSSLTSLIVSELVYPE